MTPDGMMAFDPPPPQNNKLTQTSWRGREAQSSPPDNTPARAIADAWRMETKESQDKWREADAKLKDQFNRTKQQIPLGRRAKM